jgi:hypothetical protein
MSIQQNNLIHPVNAHGTTIRTVTVYTPEKVTELSFQRVMDSWVPYKRVVHTVQ